MGMPILVESLLAATKQHLEIPAPKPQVSRPVSPKPLPKVVPRVIVVGEVVVPRAPTPEWTSVQSGRKRNHSEHEHGSGSSQRRVVHHVSSTGYLFSHAQNKLEEVAKMGPNGQLSINQYRLVAYRVVLEWALRGERLGPGNRRVLPSCIVTAIRNKYPSPTGTYKGFMEADDMFRIM
ncbi:uncharacterized protein LOC144459417 [Epinephelus lanceolatus]